MPKSVKPEQRNSPQRNGRDPLGQPAEATKNQFNQYLVHQVSGKLFHAVEPSILVSSQNDTLTVVFDGLPLYPSLPLGVFPTPPLHRPGMTRQGLPVKRIYLSGPMSGLPELNFPMFHAETARLRGLGFEVVNPAEINPGSGSWGDCMRRDIIELLNCDTIALLKGWAGSEGAFLELTIAARLGMTIVNAHDLVTREAI